MGISGVDVVTVGIPYGFECYADCYPTCQYTWTRGNVTTQGPELDLQLLHIMPPQTLTCTVVNPASGKSASVHKTLRVTGTNDQVQTHEFLQLKYFQPNLFPTFQPVHQTCRSAVQPFWLQGLEPTLPAQLTATRPAATRGLWSWTRRRTVRHKATRYLSHRRPQLSPQRP